MKVAVDCDGVLARFDASAARVANSISPGLISDPERFESTEFKWLKGKLGHQVWDKIEHTHNWWLYLEAYQESIGALQKFLWSGNIVYIVTSRCKTEGMPVEVQTQLWLRDCGIQTNLNSYIAVIVANHSLHKPDILRALRVDASIDDSPEVATAVAKNCSHPSFILDRPWNRAYSHLDGRRVGSLHEFFAKAYEAHATLVG